MLIIIALIVHQAGDAATLPLGVVAELLLFVALAGAVAYGINRERVAR